jgi:hypothetical protein
MNASKYFHRIFASAALTVMSMWAGISGASTVVVNPSNPDGWTFATVNGSFLADPTAGTAGFVTGPGTPPLGTGSAHLATTVGGGEGGAMIGTSALDGLPLSAITSLSYSTYMTSNNGQQFPYIALSFASTGSGPADDNVIFEPPYQTPGTGNPALADQGPTAMTTWQNWNAIVGGWWDGNGVAGTPGSGVVSFSDVLAAYPNAVIADMGAPYDSFLGLEFQVGLGSSGETYDGNVDDVTIGINGANTTYDFEPNAVPEPASLSLIGLAAPLLLRRRRRITQGK